MRDNLSIVITIIVLVTLIVLFPLYNYYERQDDMSYNLVLKETTNFVDEVLNYGYISQERYDQYVSSLANTGNYYEIELEAYRRQYTKLGTTGEYIEEYLLENNDDILKSVINPTSMQSANILKESYKLNEGDQFYIKLKNSNTTLAGALFNTIVPGTAEKRIAVNYGGIVKNNAWQSVHGQFSASVSSINVGVDASNPNLFTFTYADKTIDNIKYQWKKQNDVEFEDMDGNTLELTDSGIYVVIATKSGELLDTVFVTISSESETADGSDGSEDYTGSGDEDTGDDGSLDSEEQEDIESDIFAEEDSFISSGGDYDGFGDDGSGAADVVIDSIEAENIFDDEELSWEEEEFEEEFEEEDF